MTQEAEYAGVEKITNELSNVRQLITESKKAADEQYRSMKNEFSDTKNVSEELRAKVEEQAKRYADITATTQALEAGVKEVQRILESPVYGSEKDLSDHDRKVAIELQRRAWLQKGNDPSGFKPDMSNLVDPAEYRSAARKMMRVGLETKEQVAATFTEAEKRAFDAGGLGSAFFAPEFLGLELACDAECGYLLDLYGQMNVSRSTYSYIRINDYGALGSYHCSAVCDAELGPEGNISYEIGKTADFRGVFCLQEKTLREADYDILPFMLRAASRSHGINRNRVLMVGDGINEPLGWAYGGGAFPIRTTAENGKLAASDVRLFLNSIPREYGDIRAIMHQNTFAMISALLDANGNFLFGRGDILFSPESVSKLIRISNCLPDPTNGLKLSSDNITAGDFIMAAANWETAYYAVTKRPLFFQQWPGQSSAWCVKYQFGAEDGGFVGCANAGAILRAK